MIKFLYFTLGVFGISLMVASGIKVLSVGVYEPIDMFILSMTALLLGAIIKGFE